MLLSSQSSLNKYVIAPHKPHRIGIAIGPQTWFGDHFGANVSSSGTVLNNRLSGAFGYGMAITSARNFTVEGNTLFGNTSFIGSRGPNCSASDPTPASSSFIVEWVNVTTTTLQTEFQSVQDAKGLTCVQPPNGGDYWPYGGNPSAGSSNISSAVPTSTSSSASPSSGSHSSTSRKVGFAIGIIVTVVATIVVIIIVRKWALRRELKRELMDSVSKARTQSDYVKSA